MIFKDFEEYIKDNELEYSINKNNLFIYGFLFVIVFSFISKFNMTITTIFSIIFAYIIIIYLAKSNKKSKNKKKILLDKKKEHIRPREELIEKYDDIVNFLFTIQDLYIYNPPSYEEMVESIKSFLIIYDESIKIPKLAHQNYKIAEIKFFNAINSLHAIILNAKGNLSLDNKINRSFRVLYKILKKYLDEIELTINKDIKYNGYTINTVIIDPNRLKPYNFSDFYSNTFDFI